MRVKRAETYPTWPQVRAVIDAAVAAGTHAPAELWAGRVCPICGEWTRPVWVRQIDAGGKVVPGSRRVRHCCACDPPAGFERACE